MSALLMIGTRKGLFLARGDDERRTWSVDPIAMPMDEIYAVAIDKRRSPARIFASVTNSHFGPSVMTSDDLGQTWTEPEAAPIAFPGDTGEALRRVWAIVPGPRETPDLVYAGTEPAAVFRSGDGGRSFDMIRPLWDHPHRPDWAAGFGGQAFHTVLPHPADRDSVLAALSTGGVYRTADAGGSWSASNTGIRATFLPEPDQFPEFGQCVHKVTRDAVDPDRLYLQNHHGVYRSDDGGATWQSIADGLPTDFGFAIVAHPHRSGVVYNVPVEADARRFPPDKQLRVYRSEDAGASWTALGAGLPDTPHYSPVLRDALCTDDAPEAGIYFGTRTGEVYASPDGGDSWQLVADHLPDVLCVRAALVS